MRLVPLDSQLGVCASCLRHTATNPHSDRQLTGRAIEPPYD